MVALTGADRSEEIRALLVLDALPGVGPARLRRAVGHLGSGRAVLGAGSQLFEALLGASALEARAAGDAGARVDRGLAAAAAEDMRVVHWADPDYPDRLLHLADPPPVLFLRGDASLLARPGVAVVGARRATARARDVATRLGRGLAGAGVPVVSGLALGVDGAAHRGALEAGGPTVAVVATGADTAYPRAHRGLFRRVVAHGLVVSEFLPDTPALPHHFPRRNRILAAVARAVVVVEAGVRSGALITVDHALDLGLDVFAVPGPIDQYTCAGSNTLLRDGARALVSVGDFVAAQREEAGGDGIGDGDAGTAVPSGRRRASHAVAAQAAGGSGRGRPAGDRAHGPTGTAPEAGASAPEADDEARVLRALADGGAVAVDEVVRHAGVPPSRALALLASLEVRGRVERRPGARFRRIGQVGL